MLSHRPPNGLFTYNFELDRLRVTTYDQATSLALDEHEHAAKLILTLRQFRDAPRGKAKKVEIGYLFILHSGTSAIERLDLKKIRQTTSTEASPAYKIRGEGRGIVFQYLCSDGNARKIDIEFRKQLEYERALQILLSQGLSVIIKRPEHAPPRNQPFGPTPPGPLLRAVLPNQAHPIRQNSISGIPRTWNAPFVYPSYLPSPVDLPSSTPMPPPAVRDVRPPSLLGVATGNYHYPGLCSPALDNYGLRTPTQSQSQVSDEALPNRRCPSSRQPNTFLHGVRSRQSSQASVLPGSLSTAAIYPPIGTAQYGEARISRSPMPPQSYRGHLPIQHAVLPPPVDRQSRDYGGGVSEFTSLTNAYTDTLLPPTRTLPFASKNKAESSQPIYQKQQNFCDNMEVTGGQESTSREAAIYRGERANDMGQLHGTGRGQRADAAVDAEVYGMSSQTLGFIDNPQGRFNDTTNCALAIPTQQPRDREWQNDTALSTTSRGLGVRESSSRPDSEIPEIFRNLEDAVRRWRMGFPNGRDAELQKILVNLQNSAQRLHIYLRPSDLQNHDDQRNDDQRNDDHLGSQNTAREPRIATLQPEAERVETPGEPKRRHTKEYKQWRDYYLFACRLYETKEERTDPEFIHRFLRGIPGVKALRWVQMGLLNCYPSMVRLSERRSGTTIVFTKDLRWSHVRDMVTRKLRLPFPKWEAI